ncbi:MAG: C40 family peptidase, partial [Ruminococcus sp.]|nr:C40 family peptidase [Ruminococcus sp.]
APAPTPAPSGDSSKINTVLAYAKSNVGGSYVWGGASFKACDCSGLVMLSFAQVGINLPHYAASQAEYGTTVSYNNIQPGDVVFFGGTNYSSIYHVGIYIGDGLMVHAQNSATGIVISNLANFSYWGNPITVIKRLI